VSNYLFFKGDTAIFGWLIVISVIVYPFVVPPVAKASDKRYGARRLERARETASQAGRARADELGKIIKTMFAANDVLARKAELLRNVAQPTTV